MDNEYILRWLAEFGMEWVDIQSLTYIDWVHGFRWSDARRSLIEVDVKGGKYRLTQKALNKLTEKENENG